LEVSNVTQPLEEISRNGNVREIESKVFQPKNENPIDKQTGNHSKLISTSVSLKTDQGKTSVVGQQKIKHTKKNAKLSEKAEQYLDKLQAKQQQHQQKKR